jgi:MoxR-like ATPase
LRISAEAMNAALAHFDTLQYQSQVAAAYEAFLTAKWLEGHDLKPGFNEVNEAVSALFQLLPGDGLSRLRPFRYDWLVSKNSGRRTVWNNNTRSSMTKSKSLFIENDIRHGLLPGASGLLEGMLPLDAGGNPVKPRWQALAVLVLRNHDFIAEADWPDARGELMKELALSEAELNAISSPAQLEVAMLGKTEWSPATLIDSLRPQETVTVTAQVVPGSSPTPSETEAISVVVDSRVERMLRLALAAYSSILLVGPPGTGKGTLLRWLITKAQSEPTKYGFGSGLRPDPLWQTPDESWSAFELIGGLAPNESGVLSWAPGALLNAITDDRWLVLDETNRADMDKIMGPLLTWLSKQEVELGKTEAHGGVPVGLGWSADRNSKVDERSDPAGRWYLAGKDWRLLGTYNPQDAQRVFRFGQALSRRFVIVPIPVLKPGQFAELLSTTYPDLPEAASDAIAGLYSAHQAEAVTTLGPAVFLGIARYILVGLPTGSQSQEPPGGGSEAVSQSASGSLQSANGTLGATADAGQATSEIATSAPSLMGELLAEAYVLGAGRYMANYDEQSFEVLRSKVVDDEGALTQEQWSWIQSQRDVLS